MNIAELNTAWANHNAKFNDDSAGVVANEARRYALREQAKGLGKIATAITNLVGYERPSSAESGLDARLSLLIRLGQLDDSNSDDTFAFARIAVTHGFDHIQHEHVSPRGVKWLSYERVTSDRISFLGVQYYAGDAEGYQLTQFVSHEWDTSVEDEQILTAIGDDLALLAEAAVLGIEE